VVNGHSFILVHQMAALIRRALAEVCTVPVLVVGTARTFNLTAWILGISKSKVSVVSHSALSLGLLISNRVIC